jgi:hypothetical protein
MYRVTRFRRRRPFPAETKARDLGKPVLAGT